MLVNERTAPDGASERRSWAIALTAVAALGLFGCGEDEGPERGAVAPATTAEQGSTDGEARDPEREDEAPSGEAEPPVTDAARPPACTFEAPPGRLAEDTVAIELEGAGCDDARALAKAAALGQPAGANLEIQRDGFLCVPSTTTKGANVTYTCTDGGRVSFDVVWSR